MVGHRPIKLSWVNPCSCDIQFDNISLDDCIFFLLWSLLDADNQSLYIGTGIMHLCLCHATQTIVAFQNINNGSLFSASCFDDLNANLVPLV